MNNPALVSVIVPVFKVKAYLDRCVQSILNQDYKHFELLLVDDGSPDECGEMCEAWGRRDSRVRVFHKKNGGQSSARNLGLDHARGDYFTFVDSDDYVSRDYLSYLLSLFPRDPGCRVAACNHYVVRGKRKKANSRPGRGPCILPRRDAYEEVLFHGCIDVSPWAKMYRREVYETLRFPEGRLFEDTWIFGDVLARTERIAFGGRCCYFYEMHSQSTVNSAFREKNLEYIQAAQKLGADALACDPAFRTGAVRRVNHARMSVLRYMDHCQDGYKPLRQELRKEILRDAPKYIHDRRTPWRDKAAAALLRLGLPWFFFGWRMNGMFR